MTIWAHPIDVHYTLKGIDGWPRLQLEIFGVDGFGRNELGAQHAAVPAPGRSVRAHPTRAPCRSGVWGVHAADLAGRAQAELRHVAAERLDARTDLE